MQKKIDFGQTLVPDVSKLTVALQKCVTFHGLFLSFHLCVFQITDYNLYQTCIQHKANIIKPTA